MRSLSVIFCLLCSSASADDVISVLLPGGATAAHQGRILIVVSNPVDASPEECSEGYLHNVVIVDGGSNGPADFAVALFETPVSPGCRYYISIQGSGSPCGSWLGLTPITNGASNFAEGITSFTVVEGDALVVVDVVGSITDESGTYSEVEALAVGAGPPELVTLVIYEGEPTKPGDRFEVGFSEDGWLLLVGD